MGKNEKDTAGIIELFRPAQGEPDIDIVAVHGLNGDLRKTWTSKDNGVCWLNHKDFLPRYTKNARVLSWGYNASFTSLKGTVPSKDRIHHHAQTLVANLCAERMVSSFPLILDTAGEQDIQLSGTMGKPIIFICHSLGGIIVKRALSYSQLRTGPKVSHQHDIFTCTYGILFFGTPHLGSAKATWLQYLTRMAEVAMPRSFSVTESGLVKALAEESETLQNITDNFVPIMKNFCICFFWEQEQTDLKALGRGYIVSSDSAAPLFDDTERSGIASTHSGMVKFGDSSAPAFRTVISTIVRYCQEAPRATARRKEYETSALRLEREQEAEDLKIQGHRY